MLLNNSKKSKKEEEGHSSRHAMIYGSDIIFSFFHVAKASSFVSTADMFGTSPILV
jgi:hypothetical protein